MSIQYFGFFSITELEMLTRRNSSLTFSKAFTILGDSKDAGLRFEGEEVRRKDESVFGDARALELIKRRVKL